MRHFVKSQNIKENVVASYHLSVKIGKSGSGGRHAEYIERSGSYSNYRSGEDLAFTESGNMPTWAAHDPAEFFRQADLNERKNGSVYREYEVAIPRELSPEQRIEFIRDFVAAEIGTKHPYLWSIHNPNASIGLGEQPHAHIMFTDRMLDGIARDPELFFKRANSKSPEKGGCKKANIEATPKERKSALVDLRARFAQLQNDHLKKHGHESRVDHRSLADQGKERQPEKHLGPIRARDQQIVVPLLRHRGAQQQFEESKDEVLAVLKNHRKEKRHERHRQYQSRTAATRRDSVPRMHERRHLRDADRAHHLLPGNAYDRLGEWEAKERVDRMQLERKRQQWRERLNDRRSAWQNKPSIRADQAKPGKPQIYRWTVGKAAGMAVVKDYGNRLVPCGRPENISDAKINAMLKIAQQKGWKSLTLTGSQEFRERCAAAAVAHGFQLADADLAQKFSPVERDEPRSYYHPDRVARRVAANAAPPPITKQQAQRVAAPAAEAIPTAPDKSQVEDISGSQKPTAPSVEEWIKNNNLHLEPKAGEVEWEGKVLYVGQDGRWVQSLGRGVVAIRNPAGQPLEVGKMVVVVKDGQVQKMPENGKVLGK